jgi:hypothetical protein
MSVQGHIQREKNACHLAPPSCLAEIEIMYERSHVSGLSACIPGEGVVDSMPNEEKDHVEELSPDQFTPSPSTRNPPKRKRNSASPKKTSLWKKGKNPMVRVMSRMVDDVISANSVTSKALTSDFTRESIKEVMALVKEVGAVEGSDEHFIATQLFKYASNHEMFLTFETNEGRFNWLKRCYEEHKK